MWSDGSPSGRSTSTDPPRGCRRRRTRLRSGRSAGDAARRAASPASPGPPSATGPKGAVRGPGRRQSGEYRTQRTTRIRVDVARKAARNRQQGWPGGARKRHGARVDSRRSALGGAPGRAGEPRRSRPAGAVRRRGRRRRRTPKRPPPASASRQLASNEPVTTRSAPTTLEATDNVKTCSSWLRYSRSRLAHRRPPRARRPGLQGHPRDRIPAAQQSSSTDSTPRGNATGDDDVSTATLGCGLCRPRRCWRTVSGRSAGYRRGTNYIQGYTNVGDFAGTFAVGIRDRAEIFTSFLVDTRIDRDVRPIFVPTNTEFGSFVDRYPRVNRDVDGRQRRRLVSSAARSTSCRSSEQNPVALAVRGVLKIPTGDEDDRARARARPTSSSTSSAARTSRRSSKSSGYAGYEWRGEPDGFDTPGGAFRWGGGARVPDAEPGARASSN